MTEQHAETRKILGGRDGTVRLIAADHQTQIQRMPGRHRRLEALFHDHEVIAAVADRAAERCAPDRGDPLARQDIRPGQRVDFAPSGEALRSRRANSLAAASPMSRMSTIETPFEPIGIP